MIDKLVVLWISRDIETALHMGFMYAKNSKINNWWDEVDLIIWGPSTEVAATSKIVQEEIKMMQHVGVNVKACIACANRYGLVERLQELNIEVLPMGLPLTEYLKDGIKVISV